MSNITIKGLPQIKLVDLLKKKKMSLKNFIRNLGISSYQTLDEKCKKMGVASPTEADFIEATEGKIYSSPQEGVIVLEPQKLIKENTGEKVEVDFFPSDPPEDTLSVEEGRERLVPAQHEISSFVSSSFQKKKKKN